MASVLADGRALREKQTQDRAEAKLRDARSAVETLKQRNTAAAKDAQEQRKAAAKQKIDQIKARIRMLQMSGSVDPKVLAQLARELKSAVKMYGGSDGATAGIGGNGAGAAVAGESASGESAQGASEAGVEAGAEAGLEGETEAGTPAAVEGDAASTEGAALGSDGERNAETAKANDNPYRRVAEESQRRAAEQARHGAARQADRDFLSDVRNLADQIKAMAKRAQHQAETDPARRQDADQAAQAATEALRAVEDAGRDLGATGVSLTV